jgi:hypothetical protein
MLRLLRKSDDNFRVLKGNNKSLSRLYYVVTHRSGPADHDGHVYIDDTGKKSFLEISKANNKIRDDIRRKERKKKLDRTTLSLEDD